MRTDAESMSRGKSVLNRGKIIRRVPQTKGRDQLGSKLVAKAIFGIGIAVITSAQVLAQNTNHAPVAFAQSLMATQGTSVPITLTANDADGDSLTYRIVTPPFLGYLTGAPPNVLYISTTNFSTIVTDSFTFVANDGVTDSTPATVSITLFPQPSSTNTLPVLALTIIDPLASEVLNSDGTTNTAMFSILRTGNSSNDLPINLFVHGNAIYGADYFTIPPLMGVSSNSVTTVTMPAGATSMVFTLYPIPDNVTEGTETALFTLNSSSNYVVSAPSQISISILDSNAPPVAGTRIIFPPDGASYASTLDIKLRISNTNASIVKLYADEQLLTSFNSAPFLSLVTNFSVGAHTVYSVANDAMTSAPVHFNVLAPLVHQPLTPKLGIAPEANASFFIDSNGALFDWGDGRYGALADGGFTNQEQNTVFRPIQIPLPVGLGSNRRFVKVSSGSHHTMAFTSDGQLWVCGDNSSGQTAGQSTSIFRGFAGFAGVTDIAAGNLHSLALIGGTLIACGNNSFGQLGLGNTTNRSSFTTVPFPAGVTAWTSIAAGSNYSIALANNGQLYACGYGFYGTLGTGGTTNSTRFMPVALPAGVTNWLKVFPGAQHVLAIAGNGTLYAWGLGSVGQLGNGTFSNSPVPQAVTPPAGVSNWIALAAGLYHSLGLGGDGNIYTWGGNNFGQLGPGLGVRAVPTLMSPHTEVLSWRTVAAGINHSLGIGDDCRLYAWGANNFGQLGIGSLLNQTNAATVQNLDSGVCATATNQPPFAFSQSLISTQRSVLPITLSGSDPDNDPLTFRIVTPPSLGVLTGAPPAILYISTTNFLTTVTDSFTFVANDGYTDSAPATVSITLFPISGSNTGPVISITSTDAVASEVRNSDGTTNTANFTIRGTGGSTNLIQVVLVVGGTATYGLDYYTVPPLNVTSNSHTTFLTTTGPASIPFTLVPLNDTLTEGIEFASFTIGPNSSYSIGSPGQISISILDSNNVPPASTRILFPTEPAAYFSPDNIEIRVANTNVSSVKLYGDTNLLASFAPVPPTGLTLVLSIVTNFSTGEHTVYSVANNSITSAPVSFVVLSTNDFPGPHFVSLSEAPVANSSFVVVNGALFDWGDDRYGNLGDGGLSNAGPTGVTLPIQIPLPRDLRYLNQFPPRWKQVSSGGRHTLALDTFSQLYVAGDNSLAQTGNPTNSSQTFFTPAPQFPASMRWKDIAAGSVHSLALTSSGQLYAWGFNDFGQLGIGTNSTVVGPVLVPFPAGVTNWTTIAAGVYHSLALGNDGNVYAWGSGEFGTLGNGGATNSSRPQRVTFPAGVTNWVKIAAGGYHNLAISGDGKLYAWGYGGYGELGYGGTTNASIPVPVNAPSNVVNWAAISAGIIHSLALAEDGSAYGWGDNLRGELGPNASTLQPVPFLITPPSGVQSWQQISAGAFHNLAIADSCMLYSWGSNSLGQLGVGSFVPQTNLQIVHNLGDLCTAIVVTQTNHAPSFVKGPDITVPEDAGIQVVTNWATQINPGAPSETNQILTFVVTNDNSHIFSTQPGITPSGNLFFAGAPNSNGVAHVTVVLHDNGGTANGGQDTSAPQTFVITITPVNDPPVAFPAFVFVNEDTSTNIHLSALDWDGDALTYTIVAPPSHGSLSGTPPDVTYLGSANYNGPDSFTFKVNDGHVDSEIATISITVLPVSDPPVPAVRVFPSFVLSSNYSAFQVISPNNSNAVVYFDASLSSDVDGDALTFAWFDQGTNHLFGASVVATNILDLGTNSIILTVSDGQVTEFKPFDVVVISAGSAIGELIDFIQNLASDTGVKSKTWRQLIDPLQAAQSEFESGNWNAGLVHLRIFQFRVSTQIAPVDQDLANSLTFMTQQIASAIQGNTKRPPLIGALTDRRGNGKSVTFAGVPGQFYLVQASGDLAHWETIGVASETEAGEFRFDDSASANAAARYYRLVVP
jgi:alpha-tubulin suppressor-like RCC1 family protein